MFREICQKKGEIEADASSRVIEALRKFLEVDFTIRVLVNASHYVVDLLTMQQKKCNYPICIQIAFRRIAYSINLLIQ